MAPKCGTACAPWRAGVFRRQMKRMAQRRRYRAWHWFRGTVFRMKPKPDDVYECKLREVFWEGDRELAIRVGR